MATDNNVKSVKFGNPQAMSDSSSPPPVRNMAPPTPPKRDNGFRSLVSRKIMEDSPVRKKAVAPKKKLLPPPSPPPPPPPPPPPKKKLPVVTATPPKQNQSSSGSPPVLDAENYVQPISAAVLDDQQTWEEDEFDPQSVGLKVAEELYKRAKLGESYEAVMVDVERMKKRLKYLSMNPREGEATNTIEEGLEIADAASLLKLKGTSSPKIEMAGQKAQRAAALLLQAQIMSDKGKQLLVLSKRMLQSADEL